MSEQDKRAVSICEAMADIPQTTSPRTPLVWAYEVKAQRDELLAINFFSLGAACLSEDECIAQGIDFASYELGVANAIDACWKRFDSVRQKIEATK